jgi:carbon storage regulator
MLVLSRKLGESICIGANIAVVIMQIDVGRVKIGIEAPKSIPISRGELNSKCESRNGARTTATLGNHSVKDS